MKNSAPLEEKICHRSARVGVIGLGYVGLPLAVAFAEAGFCVVGFDRDADKCRRINGGLSYVRDVSPERVRGVVNAGRLRASNHDKVLKGLDVVLVCVPTPLGKTKDPDISYIVSAADRLERFLKKNN